jgi:aryl-alcohol dehydrogenase-like predicted oxidoreductase
VQVVHNVFDQAPEDELFPLCESLGVAVISRVPFDEGSLTGTLTRDTRWPEGDFRNAYFAGDKLEATIDHVDALRAVVPAGMTMPELALRYILSDARVSTVIPGMRNVAHVGPNIAAGAGRGLPAPLLATLRAHRWDRVPEAKAD